MLNYSPSQFKFIFNVCFISCFLGLERPMLCLSITKHGYVSDQLTHYEEKILGKDKRNKHELNNKYCKTDPNMTELLKIKCTV